MHFPTAIELKNPVFRLCLKRKCENYFQGKIMKLTAKLSVILLTVFLTNSLTWAEVPFIPNQGIAGSWYNPGTNGQGFLIDHLPTQANTMVVYWFTYDPENPGETFWLTGTGKLVGTSAEITFIRAKNGVCICFQRYNGNSDASFHDKCGKPVFTNQFRVDAILPYLFISLWWRLFSGGKGHMAE